jgi:DNA-binding MurR/RpiR family transcriptional regulator
MTKNITLAVDEADLNGARIYAAKRSTTVNALVRKYIANLNHNEDRLRREAIERMIERSRNGPRAESGGTITRGWGDHGD